MNDLEKVTAGKALLVRRQDDPAWVKQFVADYEATYYVNGRSATAEEMLVIAAREAPVELLAADVAIPTHCPLTHKPMESGSATSPTLDRLDANKPFEVGNVRVISREAHWCLHRAIMVQLAY